MQKSNLPLTQKTENPFYDIPKADVHNHFHLGGSKQRFFEIYKDSKIHFPNHYEGLPGMIDFITNHLNNNLTTSQDVIHFMENSITSSIDDNVKYLEASVDINLARFFDNSIEAIIVETQKLVDKYQDQIDFRPEIGINKDLELKTAYAYAEQCISSGTFKSIDLYGREANQDLSPFVALYKTAKHNHLKTKVHIGEFSDADSIKTAILLLEPDEIQHGINAIHDDYVMDMILERDIQLNICLESNIRLGAATSLKNHPIRTFYDKGIPVTVNTDDLLLFHKTNSDQFHELLQENIFSQNEIIDILNNSFPS